MRSTATIEAIFEKAKEIIVTWFSVLTRGPNAFAKIDLEANSTLVYSLKFLFFMAFVDVAVDFPLSAKIGSSFLKELAIPPVLYVEAFVEYLMTGLILYGSMKLVGGKGRLQPCTVVYCFLTAYMPIVSVLWLPVRIIVTPAMVKSLSYPNTVDDTLGPVLQLSAWNLLGIVLSFSLSTVVYVLFFRAVFQNFRILHQLNKGRARLGFIGGLAGVVIFLTEFLKPSISMILRGLSEFS
jgi:hypothetical protein